MKQFALLVLAALMFSALPSSAEAQWVYSPTIVSSRQPVRAYRQSVRMYRSPMVVYRPTTVVYARRRPVFGGYSVRTRQGFQRNVIW